MVIHLIYTLLYKLSLNSLIFQDLYTIIIIKTLYPLTKIINNINIVPSDIDFTSPKPSLKFIRSTSAAMSQLLSLLNAFSCIIDKVKGPYLVLYNTCLCLIPEYNANYNLYAIPSRDWPSKYDPYAFKEPLFDN